MTMTDEELRTLIQEKSPADLTPEECAALREAVRRSARQAVRRSLGSGQTVAAEGGEKVDLLREVADRIQIDEYLARALGRPQVSAERVLARLAARRRRAIGEWTRYGLVVCCGLAALFAGLVTSRGWRDRPQPQEVAHQESAEPAVAAVETVAVESPAEPPRPLAEPEKPASPEPVPTPSPAAVAIAAPATFPPPRKAGLFEPPGPDDATPDDKSLGRWFAAVEKLPLKFSSQPIEDKPCGRFEGIARLQRPLVDGAAMRMQSPDFTGVRIHVWSGEQGVSFAAFPQPLRWIAYATTRSGTGPLPLGPLPTGYATIGLDDGRMLRTALAAGPDAGGGVGTDGRMLRTNPVGVRRIELRYADGLVTLARGDVRLVEAPLAGPPTDVFFEGAATFHDMAMVAAAPIPPLRSPAARPAADLLVAGKGAWVRGGDQTATFAVHDDGTATLTAVDTKQPAWAVLPLPAASALREITVRLEGVAPGTGLVLADGAGNPQSVLRFLANPNSPPPPPRAAKPEDPTPKAPTSGSLQLDRKPPADNTLESAEPLASRPFTFVGETVWLRLRQCGGVQRLDVSGDGRHWVLGAEPQPAFAALGLHAVPHPSGRSITIAALGQAEFPRLESLAPAELRGIAVELPSQGPFAAWLAAADAARPTAADIGAWRRACAVKALGGSAAKDLAIDLLGFLFRESFDMESFDMDMQPAARQDLLDEILAVAPVADDPAAAARIASLFDALGARLAMEGEERCSSAIGHEQLAAPLLSGQPLVAFSEPLARREIVGLFHRGEWRAADEFLARLTFLGFTATPRNEFFFTWAASLARFQAAGKPAILDQWRPPLAVDLSNKESLRVGAELNVLLDAGAYADACRLFDAAAAKGEVDLLTDRRDPHLFMSLPVVVATAMRDEPRLLETMRQERERIAGLRVLEATAAGNQEEVEATTVQFHGTLAAAKAHVWLGDRSLAAGFFTRALRNYQAAAALIPKDDEEQRKPTLAAIDLARKCGATFGASAPPSPPSLAQATSLTATLQARLEGDVGGNPAGLPAALAQGGVDWPPHAIDWVARQIAVVPLGDRLLVSNRFQLASHDPATGAVQWRVGLGGEAGEAHQLHGQPMRPVADAARAYVRRLRNGDRDPDGQSRSGTPALAAITLADGVVAWELPSTSERRFVSDPLPSVGNSLAICVARKQQEGITLALSWLDAATGRLIRELPIATFGGAWWGWNVINDCQLTEADGIFFVAAGGAVISCDDDGRVRWERRELYLPWNVDAAWMLSAQSPPLLRDGRIHVVQPCSPGLATLDAASGRLLWRLADVSVSRLRGIARGRLVVERIGTVATAGSLQPGQADLVAIDAATGKQAWRYGPADLLDASLVTDEGVLAAVREPNAGKNARIATLVLLDPETGRELRRWPLAACEDPHPFLGPLVPSAGGLRVFFGRGPTDATRDLMLLAP